MSHSFDSWHPGWHVNAVAVWILGLLWGSACWLRYLFHLKFFSKGLITKGVIRERQRKRERERERKREEEEEEEDGGRGSGRGRERKFALEKSAAMWTLRTNLLKWIGPSDGPVWTSVEKLFFDQGFIRDLVPLGKADKQDCSRNNVKLCSTQTFFSNKMVCQDFLPQ